MLMDKGGYVKKVEGWTERDLVWYWFSNIRGVGLRTRWKLLEVFDDVFHIWEAEKEELKQWIPARQANLLVDSRAVYDPKPSIDLLAGSGTRFLHWESPDYPSKLRHIFEPPTALYIRGKLPDEHQPALAMVGSRRASHYGKKMAGDFARIFAESGIQIISGMAAGIDTESHWGAIKGGGYTAGILGGGIDTIFPKGNFNLYYEMYEHGGVISEYNIGTANASGLFPIRNRIISGLSDGVFLIEAGRRSGSLITADQGLDQGREIFVLPGRVTDPMSQGCNALIAQGAVPVLDPDTILNQLLPQRASGKDGKEKEDEENDGTDCLTGIRKDRGRSVKAGKNSTVEDKAKVKRTEADRDVKDRESERVLALLDPIDAVSFEALLQEGGMSRKKLEKVLFDLEMKGQIHQPVQGLYQREAGVDTIFALAHR